MGIKTLRARNALSLPEKLLKAVPFGPDPFSCALDWSLLMGDPYLRRSVSIPAVW